MKRLLLAAALTGAVACGGSLQTPAYTIHLVDGSKVNCDRAWHTNAPGQGWNCTEGSETTLYLDAGVSFVVTSLRAA
jgi:hypothetical protein